MLMQPRPGRSCHLWWRCPASRCACWTCTSGLNNTAMSSRSSFPTATCASAARWKHALFTLKTPLKSLQVESGGCFLMKRKCKRSVDSGRMHFWVRFVFKSRKYWILNVCFTCGVWFYYFLTLYTHCHWSWRSMSFKINGLKWGFVCLSAKNEHHIWKPRNMIHLCPPPPNKGCDLTHHNHMQCIYQYREMWICFW